MNIKKYVALTKSDQAKINGGTRTGASGGQGGLNPIQKTRATSELGLVNVEQQRM